MTVDTNKYLDFVTEVTSLPSTDLAALLSRITELDIEQDADVPRLLTAALGLTAEAVENIDIGGPSMVRSAAKNHKDVAVLTNPNQYGIYLDSIKGNISIKPETLRKQFMLEAFKHTAEYDATISEWMSQNQGD